MVDCRWYDACGARSSEPVSLRLEVAPPSMRSVNSERRESNFCWPLRVEEYSEQARETGSTHSAARPLEAGSALAEPHGAAFLPDFHIRETVGGMAGAAGRSSAGPQISHASSIVKT